MKKDNVIQRRTAAHLMAEDMVSAVAEVNLQMQINQVKYEKYIDSIYEHYVRRVYWLFNGLVISLLALAYMALK